MNLRPSDLADITPYQMDNALQTAKAVYEVK